MYVAQQCFGLSAEESKDAIYDSQALCGFVGICLARESCARRDQAVADSNSRVGKVDWI